MALMITDECTSCGACEVDCPNEAISEGEATFVVDFELCTECVGFHDEPQCVSVCPSDCIVPDPSHAESREQLLTKKTRLHGA
jgi:ferredoxin